MVALQKNAIEISWADDAIKRNFLMDLSKFADDEGIRN